MSVTRVPEVSADVELLYRPFTFGRATLRNRIAMAPMTRNHSPGGVPGEDVVRYYARRARGGAGLVITEGTPIDHPGANGYRNVPAFYGKALAGWKRVVDAVHGEGALIVPQLWHVGSVRRAGMEPFPDVRGMGPDAIVEGGETVVSAMTQQDIHDVVASYARAARAAEETGFDGIEIHGAHGYLPDQFLWEHSNHRTDGYGGSLENRTRFSVEMVRAIRRQVSADFPVIFRFSQWKMSDYKAQIAADADELGRILRPLAAAGVDVFHASTRRFWEPAFEGSTESLAACARRLTGKPVIAVGSIGLAQQHETRKLRTRDNVGSEVADLGPMLAAMAREDFDLVAVGRGMLADAEWAHKVRGGDTASLNALTEDVMQALI
ncbi:MAG: 12-oxophytodienoate reductase [Variovorax sp.]|nr:MAG: 12-oxophytodienoate reductase [Variovorax sp.]